MRIRYIHDSGKEEIFPIDKDAMCNPALEGKLFYLDAESKLQSALDFFTAYFSRAKSVLLDTSNKQTLQKVRELGVASYRGGEKSKSFLEEIPFRTMLFTSGSTGEATGAFKSAQNLESELHSLQKLVQAHRIEQVVVTVPFVHIYGILAGLLLPHFLDLDIVFKEHFLPADLAALQDRPTLVVTTPLYIKSLQKLALEQRFEHSCFLSSTAPLDSKIAGAFVRHYDCALIQIFGSTETGGIAYKERDDSLWRPLERVEITRNAKGLLRVRSPFVSQTLLDGELRQTGGEVQTFDYIRMEKEGFELIGRDSKIVKIAGKRYSTQQMEDILEAIEGIERALVQVEYLKESLRGEKLQIYLQSPREWKTKQIRDILQKNLSNIHFTIELHRVDEIPVSQMGKKLAL